jgi:hypothetical protein
VAARRYPQEPDPQGQGPIGPERKAAALRRPSDVVQSWLTAILLVFLVLGAPAAALGTGTVVYRSDLETVRTQSAERHRVAARLAVDADPGAVQSTGEGTAKVAVPVRWTDEDGRERTATTAVEPGARAGTTVRIWVDREGAVTTAPMSPSNAMASAWVTGVLTACVMAAGSVAARAALVRLLDRRRYAQWEAEWELLEPRWSGRLRG